MIGTESSKVQKERKRKVKPSLQRYDTKNSTHPLQAQTKQKVAFNSQSVLTPNLENQVHKKARKYVPTLV